MTRATRLRGRPAVPARLRTVDLHLRLTPEQRAALARAALVAVLAIFPLHLREVAR